MLPMMLPMMLQGIEDVTAISRLDARAGVQPALW